MELPDVNYLAVLAAAVSAFVLGGLWYSPILFAKKWMAYTGNECAEGEKPKGNMGVIFGGAFLLSVIAAYLFAMIVPFDRRLAERRDRRRDHRHRLRRDQLRHLLSVRAAPARPVADQRRLPRAAVHALRHRVRADGGLFGLGSARGVAETGRRNAVCLRRGPFLARAQWPPAPRLRPVRRTRPVRGTVTKIGHVRDRPAAFLGPEQIDGVTSASSGVDLQAELSRHIHKSADLVAARRPYQQAGQSELQARAGVDTSCDFPASASRQSRML